jgi:hypothetical protein
MAYNTVPVTANKPPTPVTTHGYTVCSRFSLGPAGAAAGGVAAALSRAFLSAVAALALSFSMTAFLVSASGSFFWRSRNCSSAWAASRKCLPLSFVSGTPAKRSWLREMITKISCLVQSYS